MESFHEWIFFIIDFFPKAQSSTHKGTTTLHFYYFSNRPSEMSVTRIACSMVMEVVGGEVGESGFAHDLSIKFVASSLGLTSFDPLTFTGA